MKKLFPVLVLSIIFAVPAFADMEGMGMGMGMMGHGEHGRGECREMMGRGGGCGQGGMPHMGPMQHMMHMCVQHGEMLGLSDQQVAKIKAIHRNLARNIIKLSCDEKLIKMDLAEIMEVKDFDLDKASATVQRIARIETEIHLEILKAMKGVRGILTDEQFKKMKGMMGGMMGCRHESCEMMHERHEHHEHMSPPEPQQAE